MTIDWSVIIPAIAVIVAALIYFAGVQRRKSVERKKLDNDRQMETDRRQYELRQKLVDEYATMANNYKDSGPHALARLNLDQLGSDSEIRSAIEEMANRTNGKVWSKHEELIKDVDLVKFFRYVRENKINLSNVPVEEVAKKVT